LNVKMPTTPTSTEPAPSTKPKIDSYVPPRVPLDAAIFFAVLFYFAVAVLVRTGFFSPVADTGTIGTGAPALAVQDALERFFPGGLAGFTWLVQTIFLPVLGIHLTEAWWMDRSRLCEHGVRRGSGVWWLWVGSTFVEGFMAFRRFDLLVERKAREEEGKRR
jgi:hypothetical protein